MPQRLIRPDCHDRGVVGQFHLREPVSDRLYAAPRGPARLAVAFLEGDACRTGSCTPSQVSTHRPAREMSALGARQDEESRPKRKPSPSSSPKHILKRVRCGFGTNISLLVHLIKRSASRSAGSRRPPGRWQERNRKPSGTERNDQVASRAGHPQNVHLLR